MFFIPVNVVVQEPVRIKLSAYGLPQPHGIDAVEVLVETGSNEQKKKATMTASRHEFGRVLTVLI